MEIDDYVYELSKDIVLRKVERLHLYWAFNVSDGSRYRLNHTAYLILEMLAAGGQSLVDILNSIVDAYEVDLEQSQKDLKEILEELLYEGVVMRKEWRG